MNCVAVILAAVLSIAFAVPTEHYSTWNDFKVTHGKVYDTPEEENYRLSVFSKTLRKIEEHNERYDAGLETYEMGINEFSDMTDEEFVEYLTLSGPPPDYEEAELYETSLHGDLPAKVDWRDKGACNPARKQGSCGACWAFSAVGTLESVNFLKTGKLYLLSVQNLIDCSFDQNNYGCLGGWASRGLTYVKLHGIEKEEDYPYQAKNGKCQFDESKSVLKTQGFIRVPANESALQAAVAEVGPLSISVDASEFKYYKGGIFSAKQPFTKLNHGVILDGYGSSGGQDYWLVRNTWGPTWGEKGYIRIERNTNQIGIASKAVYPKL